MPNIFYSFRGPIIKTEDYKNLPKFDHDKLFHRTERPDEQIKIGIIY